MVTKFINTAFTNLLTVEKFFSFLIIHIETEAYIFKLSHFDIFLITDNSYSKAYFYFLSVVT